MTIRHIRRIIDAWLDLGLPIDESEDADFLISDEIALAIDERVRNLEHWRAEHRSLAAIEKTQRTEEQRERLRELARKLTPVPLSDDKVLAKLSAIEELLRA